MYEHGVSRARDKGKGLVPPVLIGNPTLGDFGPPRCVAPRHVPHAQRSLCANGTQMPVTHPPPVLRRQRVCVASQGRTCQGHNVGKLNRWIRFLIVLRLVHHVTHNVHV
jgi:hypothetical protein